jgi:hypothetical protein
VQRIQLRRKRLILHEFSGRREHFCIHVIADLQNAERKTAPTPANPLPASGQCND